MPHPIPEEKIAALEEMLSQGRKLDAIKLYRGLAGVGLAEAKGEVEKLEAELRLKFPEKFPARPQSKGCLGAAVFMLLCGTTVVYFLLST